VTNQTEQFTTMREMSLFKDFSDIELWEILPHQRMADAAGADRADARGRDGRHLLTS